jgi:lipopolysaccharide/colanic/teichoic acid biosynthesis glycosyltransferase
MMSILRGLSQFSKMSPIARTSDVLVGSCMLAVAFTVLAVAMLMLDLDQLLVDALVMLAVLRADMSAVGAQA